MPLARFTKLLFQRFQFSSLILKRYLRHFFRASISTIFVAFLGDVPLGGFHFFSSISRVDFIIVPILRDSVVNSKKYSLPDYSCILSIYLFAVPFVKNTLFLLETSTCEQGKMKIDEKFAKDRTIDNKKLKFKRFANKYLNVSSLQLVCKYLAQNSNSHMDLPLS